MQVFNVKLYNVNKYKKTKKLENVLKKEDQISISLAKSLKKNLLNCFGTLLKLFFLILCLIIFNTNILLFCYL